MIFFLPSPVVAAASAAISRPALVGAWPFRRKSKPKFRQPVYRFPPRPSGLFHLLGLTH